MSGEPVVVVTGRGKVHKAIVDFRGKVVGHPRCRLQPDARVLGEPWAAFDYELLRHPYAYCRYRWCFRDVVIDLGLDPAVGHSQRYFKWRPA